jgi:hypothetical protein
MKVMPLGCIFVMLILFLNNTGNSVGKIHLENAFYRSGDYIINNKVIQAHCYGDIHNLILYTTNDVEVRLLDQQTNLLVSAHPTPLSHFYFRSGDLRLFPIESLKIPIYSKDHYQEYWEPETDLLEL